MYWVRIAPETPHGFNFPVDAVNGWLQVIATDALVVKQIFYRYGTKNATGNYTYIRTSYSNGWSDWIKLVTNTDLQTRFNPIRIDGAKKNTFSSVLKDKCNNAVNFIAFAENAENPITDNPFSFAAGYVIVFHSGLIRAKNVFTAIGVSADAEAKIETKRLDLMS